MRCNGALLLTAMIWGAAFVAQSIGMDYIQPYTFLMCRSILGCLVLLPVIHLMDRRGSGKKPATKTEQRRLWLAGICCGVFLFGGSALQQIGIQYTTAGKSGFFTSLYIILVPIFGLFLGKRPRIWIWVSALCAVAGLYLLCGSSLALGPGELLTLACAGCFALHIMVIDRVIGDLDGVRLSCLQFLVVAILSAICMAFTETPQISSIVPCWLPICYAGILSSGVGYTLQILAQAHTEPAVASLLMSMESVFSMLFGWIILHQSLSGTELLGCGLVFGAVLLAQLPEK